MVVPKNNEKSVEPTDATIKLLETNPAEQKSSLTMDMSFHEKYHSGDDIINFFKERAKLTNVYVKTEVLGVTYEKREVIGKLANYTSYFCTKWKPL